jgi:16S rRNA (guanine1207-N2)-methyltransferase
MSASLLSEDSAAAHRSRDLLADFPQFAEASGLPQARMLTEYIIGRRAGELDVSGRDAAGAFIAAEAVAEVPHEIILIDDSRGIQTALLARLAEVVGYHDRIDEARATAEIDGATEVPALTDLATHASDANQTDANHETWAVINAPKAMSALAESVAALQPHVSTMIVIGRSDSMSRAVNKELSRGFGRVDVSPGVGKNRMIIASRPLTSPSLPSFPKHGVIDHPGIGELEVRAHGACFSGTKSDEGSRLLFDALLDTLPGDGGTASDAVTAPGSNPAPAPNSVLDLGCGNGWLLSAVMRATGALRGAGVDVLKAAAASARETAAANGIDVDIVLGDAADPDDPDVAGLGEFDLIVLNPPFHQGTAIETDTAEALMATAARHLAPGGRVLTVFNTHLRYRDRLEGIIGDSEQLARNKKFTVISSHRG